MASQDHLSEPTNQNLAGQSSSGKFGGREVKTSALVSRRSWVRIPPESPVKVFFTDTWKAPSMQCRCIYTRRCRAKISSHVWGTYYLFIQGLNVLGFLRRSASETQTDTCSHVRLHVRYIFDVLTKKCLSDSVHAMTHDRH